MSALPTCMPVYHLGFWCVLGDRRGVKSPEIGIIDAYKPPQGVGN